MNGPGDIPLTLSSTPDTRPCSIISIIPTLGMSSCRGRAEAFARRLSSKLRTLGSQTEDDPVSPEGEPIINGGTTNTWLSSNHDGEQTVTDLQPLRHESDSFFDFDCELESPGSPVDECEYLRLIETASNTPHNSTESGYVCASAASSHSSNDAATFHDAINHIECNATNANNLSNSNSNNNLSTSPTTTTTTTKPTADVGCDVVDFVSKVQMNDLSEKLTNGHNHVRESTKHNSPNDELEPHSYVYDDVYSTTAATTMTTMTTAVPPSPVQHNATSSAAEGEEPVAQPPSQSPPFDQNGDHEHKHEHDDEHHEICAKEMIRMQADIINDLQKQSDEYRDDSANASANASKAAELSSAPEHANDTREATSEPDSTQTAAAAALVPAAATATATATVMSTHTQNHTINLQACEPVEPGGDDEQLLQIEITEQQQPIENEIDQITTTTTATTTTESETELNSSESSDTLQATTPTLTPAPTPTTSPTKSIVEQQHTTTSPRTTSPINDAANAKQQQQQRNSALDTTDDEDECRPQRVRRCSSLKTGKTPPGTPGRKKIVRFADVLGLDLADVKTFLDEVPTIPKSAFEDLEIMDAEPPMQLGPKSDKLLMPLFQQPGGLATFLDIVREKLVSLENAAVTDHVNQTITGSVRVRNLDFHKSVHIRYSQDGWRSFADLQANYVQNSCDGFSDKFTFVLFGNTLQIGQRMEFAVRFQCKGQQFWDNNYGANYCFQCLPSSTSVTQPLHPIVPSHHAGHAGMLSPTVGDAWCSSFY